MKDKTKCSLCPDCSHFRHFASGSDRTCHFFLDSKGNIPRIENQICLDFSKAGNRSKEARTKYAKKKKAYDDMYWAKIQESKEKRKKQCFEFKNNTKK